jgi:alpha-1,6-mannosyltransferase
MERSGKWVLGVSGTLLIAACLGAFALGDLREHTAAFVCLFSGAFLLYALACTVVLGGMEFDHRLLIGIFAVPVLMLGVLVFMHPALSDDMYRYVWDGRVQAQGVSPYRYPPNAPELAFLRDADIYPYLNRKSAVTVYPPGAQAVFGLLWRIWPDSEHWFQAVMAAGGMLAGGLLVGVLRALGRPPARALILLWSPLLAFETAHAAHLDGLILPLLVGAWWARLRERDGLTGILLGLAAALKFYPAVLLPFLWRPQHPGGRWRMPLAFGAAVSIFYLPYLIAGDRGVLGFLPEYFHEAFNTGPLVSSLNMLLDALGWGASFRLPALALGVIALAAGWCILHPAEDGETALRRCLWPMAAVTLTSQNLFSWYMLWTLPLVAIFLEPSRMGPGGLRFPRVDAWTGWWLFCGLVGLSYTFFLNWKPLPWAILAQFLPLYAILLIDFGRSLAKHAPFSG